MTTCPGAICGPVHRQRTLLVAHEPGVSLLLVLLTDSPGVDLAAGGAASLRIHGPLAPGCASVGWLVVPSMLRGLRSRRTGSRPKKTEVEAEAEARARQGAGSMA